MHRRWLAGLRFEQPAHPIVLEDCIAAVEAATARRDRLEAHIEAALADWSLAPVVRALQALRGMALVAAATLVAELGDIARFANPRQLMAYLGLAPSEHSSGARAASRKPGMARRGECWSRPPGAIGSRRASVESNCCDRKAWPSRSGTSRGGRRNGCVGAIASSPGWENHPLWSRPRSRESWRALPGRSPNTFRLPALEALRSMANITKGGHRPQRNPSKAEQGWRRGHGQENPRIHYQPEIIRRLR